MKKLLMVMLSLAYVFTAQAAVDESTKEGMRAELKYLAQTFRTTYAPSQWKNKHSGWDLDNELNKALSRLDQKGEELNVRAYHKIVADFFRSTQDYHVGFGFDQTERATLPFSVKEAEGKFIIAWVDRSKVTAEHFPYNAGDEITHIDDRPVEEVIQELVGNYGQGVLETDRAMASWMLTSRSARAGMDVPRGTVELTLIKNGKSESRTHQMIWAYTPEQVIFHNVSSAGMNPTNQSMSSLRGGFNINEVLNTQMTWNHPVFEWSIDSEEVSEEAKKKKPEKNPYRMASKKSFIPRLGKVIWESTEKDEFDAYIYINEKNQMIGYVRIPHYGGADKRFDEFKKHIKKFVEFTDGLVIDQINNPGGSLFYIYALQSVLSDRLLHSPLEHIKIHPTMVQNMSGILESMRGITNNEEAQKYLGKRWDGHPISYQTVEYLREFARTILEDWSNGKTLSRPTYVWGIDKVNPDKEVNYTKPIVVLTNELDFSGGDFFPAILQDNKRAKILGVRTAGAGGFVNSTRHISPFGLSYFSFTGSLAKRVNDQPIENLGVTPDIPYALTLKDYRGGFADYKKKINESMTELVDKDIAEREAKKKEEEKKKEDEKDGDDKDAGDKN